MTSPRRIAIPKNLRDFARVFREAGFSCYVVGGAVRDSLLGLPVNDWDAATDARPEDVLRLFRAVIPTGIKHGTVTVRWRGASIETTTFRVDGDYLDGRHPESVRFTSDLVEDLSRRDFTINGMAADPESGEVVDPHGGLSDLSARVVKAIGDPAERFEEDGLRAIRAVRFASRLGFSIARSTLAAIPGAIGRFRQVSAERIRDEFTKILLSEGAGEGVRRLQATGLLAEFLPELAASKGVAQGGPHRYDVFDHLAAACDAAPNDLVLRLAALLHDIGKPARRVEHPDGSLTFYGHDLESARLVEAALRRLKYPNAVVDEVTALVRNHMFDYDEAWTDAAVRRFVARVGLDNVKPLALLRLADSSAMGQGPADPRSVMPLIARVEAFVAQEQALSLKDLAVNGNDLAASGWPRGPALGKALAELLEAVLEDPALNERERLLGIAERIKGKYGLG